MERSLSKELACELKIQIAQHEDWLVKRILHYAKKQGYTAYTSTLEEAWRGSIVGLSRPILETPATSFFFLELNPHSDFSNDPYALFGVLEAKRHRERGIDLIMFLGLFKYYRQTYEDLLFKIDLELEDVKICRTFLKRYFDRVELGFIDEWMKHSSEDICNEMSEANRRLTNEKTLYLTTLESLEQPILVVDSNCEVTVMNESAAALFSGKSSPGAVYYGGQEASLPTVLKEKLKEELMDDDPSDTFVMILSGKIYNASFSKMKDVSGRFLGLTVILNDITDKRNAESYLKESEVLRRAFMDGVDAAALVLDMETRDVVDFNSNIYELFSDVMTDGLFDGDSKIFYDDMSSEPCSIFELAERAVNNEEKFISINDSQFSPVRLFSVEVWFQNKKHRIIIIFDISREKMLETRANHIQHLEVLGDIAGSLPDMLGPNIKEIMYELSISEEPKMLGKVSESVTEVAEIIDALESIVRYETENACIDLNQLLKNCIVLTKDKWSPYAEISIKLNADSVGLRCSPDEMGQVFLNLLVNSAYAVRKKFEADGERGCIEIFTRFTSNFFEVRIKDTGIGIKKSDYKRIFDQGFTTKQLGRVTGNGLAIVYDIIVKRLKGTIEFKSTEGKGSEFILRLPIS